MADANWPTDNKILMKIIQEYADLWADVILDKNLARSRQKITEDIKHVEGVIRQRKDERLDTTRFNNISEQLSRLEKIIRDKKRNIDC